MELKRVVVTGLGAITPVGNGMLRVLEAARKTDVQKIIFSSSAAVYGDNPALPLTENLIQIGRASCRERV